MPDNKKERHNLPRGCNLIIRHTLYTEEPSASPTSATILYMVVLGWPRQVLRSQKKSRVEAVKGCPAEKVWEIKM